MLRPDLKKYSISEIRLYFKAKITENLQSKIKTYHPDRDGDYVFFDSYKYAATGYVSSAVLSLSENTGEFNCTMTFIVKNGGRLNKHVPRTGDILEALCSVGESINFDCLLRFAFGKRPKPSIVINLPLKVTSQDNALFNDIYGIHFAKRNADIIEYEVILDYSDDDGLVETTVFKHISKFSASILDEIMQRGMGISKKFASKE